LVRASVSKVAYISAEAVRVKNVAMACFLLYKMLWRRRALLIPFAPRHKPNSPLTRTPMMTKKCSLCTFVAPIGFFFGQIFFFSFPRICEVTKLTLIFCYCILESVDSLNGIILRLLMFFLILFVKL
jgi:uncharacterized membrane protein YfcA